MFMLNNYMSLSPKQPENNFGKSADLTAYSRGMGAIGLPGDLSSASRFAKVAFTKLNSVSGDSESESVSQFFHILGSVDQQRGCCEVSDGNNPMQLSTGELVAELRICYVKVFKLFSCLQNAVAM
jgi:penicillin V amidase